MEALIRWLIARFGEAVLQWTVQQLYDRLSGEELPHGDSCMCGCHEGHDLRLDPDFDADELGIDPEGEGWDTVW